MPNHYGSATIGASGSPNHRALRLGPRPSSISLVDSFGLGFVWMPSLLRHQSQANPCRCSRRVVSIDERIGSGCASNPMRVLIRLTALCEVIDQIGGWLTQGVSSIYGTGYPDPILWKWSRIIGKTDK